MIALFILLTLFICGVIWSADTNEQYNRRFDEELPRDYDVYED